MIIMYHILASAPARNVPGSPSKNWLKGPRKKHRLKLTITSPKDPLCVIDNNYSKLEFIRLSHYGVDRDNDSPLYLYAYRD